jgi:carboxylesterase type B
VIGTAQVELNYTTYEGLCLSNGVNSFRGMRYAAPPLGNLRWRAPVEPGPTPAGTVEVATTVCKPSVNIYSEQTPTFW